MESPKLRRCVDAIDRELSRARRHGHALSVLAVEVPRPEVCPEEDTWEAQIGATLRTSARGADQFLPAGGDRWLAILPETPHEGALHLVERITRRVGDLAERVGAPILLAFGIADRHAAGDGEGVLRTAETRLVLAPSL
ncbi:MAG: hypothetical protein IPJ34_39130 [Myxococcales bacterium]|nr:hypothetical protein [Myxococcales bacterium]MBL8715551.1 hypothetical protein [Myxococcales bacterium]